MFDAEWEKGTSECLKIEDVPKQRACMDAVGDAWLERRSANLKAREAREAEARKAREAKAEKARRARESEDAKTAPQRARLAAEYKALLAKLYPRHNYIDVVVERSGKGFALYGRHPLFTRYEFDYGEQGPAVSAWVVRVRGELISARINRAGIKTDDGATRFYSF